ncbi:unnamed protein product [Acanthoscelides obtectus]|uniref:MADF domain-containing protein n=1 Tax=Acanthoscelides obtectus TaxID=200917 RepID=A0A9P0KQX5_ACAOB|nr:unnamed protein product [Acanthoscelides obtectus]CAK1681397.1 hypothetical protein AOBTE_LOCUS33127 [Acanthoscelides obtectus]
MQEDHMRARDSPSPPPAPRSFIANEKVEELIDEVSKRPALYKKDMKQYSDINVKKKLWEEVCEALISNWGKLSANERKDQGHDIKKKKNGTICGAASLENLKLKSLLNLDKQLLNDDHMFTLSACCFWPLVCNHGLLKAVLKVNQTKMTLIYQKKHNHSRNENEKLNKATMMNKY